jgi:hypothetical protein
MNSADRRKEARYVVIGIDATLNGMQCTIVDISASAVRLLRPDDLGTPVPNGQIVFRLAPQDSYRRRTFRVSASLLRWTDLELIYSYPLPSKQWETMLQAHDTFLQTQLTAL